MGTIDTSLSSSSRACTTLVENQKSKGHCLFIHIADMASTTIRMITGLDVPHLSPEPLANAHLKENADIDACVANPNLGLTVDIGQEVILVITLVNFLTNLTRFLQKSG